MKATIRASGITKRYDGVVALADVDLLVEPGHVHALLGPSGCGKTTLLRIVSGLERPDSGSVYLRGEVVCGTGRFVPPEQRNVGMVFQDYALFPHLDVRANIGFGLRPADPERVARLLEMTGLEQLADRFPAELSGGERQRVALARALAPGAELLLLDEPFSNLDARLRSEMRVEVRRILQLVGATALFVTHDRREAFAVADRVSVLMGGRIVQTATPREIYARPANAQVAAFVGEANLLAGRADGGTAQCALGVVELAVPCSGPVTILVRPEQIELGTEGAAVTVRGRSFVGDHVNLDVEASGGARLSVRVGAMAEPPADSGLAARVVGSVMAWPDPSAAG